jgi:excisionase family DNA binding protein
MPVGRTAPDGLAGEDLPASNHHGMATTTPGMTIPEAASALGVSERTVWRYLRAGRLRGETIGPVGQQRTLVDRTAVQAVMAGRGGEEGQALRARVEALSDEVAGLRAERDQLRTALAATRSELARLHKPVSRRAGDLVMAGLTSLAARRTPR